MERYIFTVRRRVTKSITLEPTARCFTIVDSVNLLPSAFSTEYRSAVIFGEVKIVEDSEEKRAGLIALVEKLSPDFIEKGIEYVDRAIDRALVLRMDIERMTGKAKKPMPK